MIEFVEGDFFDYPADIRVNTVNCVGVMGAGVALLFKKKYPAMYNEYVQECNLGKVEIGKPHVWHNNPMFGEERITIINLPTKIHWKKPSEYDYVEKGLQWLKQYLADKGNVTVTLPALGCGHGGLDWNIVRTMISNYLGSLTARLLVFAPASSTKKEATDDTLMALAKNEIRKLSPSDSWYPVKLKGKASTNIYVKGKFERLNEKILSIIVDSKADEREKNAVYRCLETLPNDGITYLLGFGSSFEIDLVKCVLEKKAKAILIVPYGILSLKIRKDLYAFWDDEKITVISIAEPNQTWKINESISALRFRFKMSDAVLITNYNYEFLKRFESDLKEVDNEVFYINYWTNQIEFYNEINAKQIGKNKDTHLPNMKPILAHFY